MTNNRHPRNTHPKAEQHHGDLRKGAYLRRRAAYQMQAAGGSRPQAGLTTKTKNDD